MLRSSTTKGRDAPPLSAFILVTPEHSTQTESYVMSLLRGINAVKFVSFRSLCSAVLFWSHVLLFKSCK